MAEIMVEQEGAVATVILNRPAQLNTISQGMLDALSAMLLACDQDATVRAVIVTGAGRAFCAGLDLKDAASEDGVPRGGFGLGASLDIRNFPPNVLYHMDTPTLCAVNGAAAGFGLDLALGCDIRIASTGSKLAAVFTRRGVVPESGGTWYLPRLLGWAKAAEIIFARKSLSGAECLELGLVNQLVADDQLLASAHAMAAAIASCAPLAVRGAKRMMRAGLNEGFDEHVERVYLQGLPLLQSDDSREGFSAFLEERPPSFKGN